MKYNVVMVDRQKCGHEMLLPLSVNNKGSAKTITQTNTCINKLSFRVEIVLFCIIYKIWLQI